MKTKNILVVLAFMAAGLAFTGCFKPWNHVEGNYDVVSETRYLPTFNRMANEGIFDVYVIQDNESMVVIEAESNLVPLVETDVSGNRLEVKTDHKLDPHYPIKVFIHTPDIREVILSGSGFIHADNIVTSDYTIGLSGSGDIFSSVTASETECTISGSGSAHMGVDANRLHAAISGSGSMEFWGVANRAELEISGSGSFHNYELETVECYVNISGSGSMYVNVAEYLDVTISGSGSVFYLGNPVISTHITGSGSVIKP